MIKVLPKGRIIFDVPPPSMKPWASILKVRVDGLLSPTCLDYCWVAGRGQQRAEKLIQPGWQFCDIKRCFASIEQRRLWHLIKDQALRAELRRFFAKLGCESGLPEGCSFSPGLANLYLAEIDHRWHGRAVRMGDNWACDNRRKLTKELRDIGFVVRDRNTLVGPDSLVRS